MLREAGFEADTVDDEGLSGAEDWDIAERTRSDGLALLLLDLDFLTFGRTRPNNTPASSFSAPRLKTKSR